MSVDSVRSEGPADHKFAEWCATPAEDRLQYLVGGGGAGASMTKDRQSENTALADDITPVNNYTFDSDDSNDDDEVLQRIIEQSKQDNQISDEEKTKLAVEQSKLDLLPMETLDENEQLEVAIKMSLGATFNKINHARIPPVSQRSDHEIFKSSSSTPLVLTPPLSVSPPSHPDTDQSVRPKTTRPTSLVSQPRITIPDDLSTSFPPGAVVGFTYWKRVLKYLDVNDYKSVDLEEYYGKLNQEELSSVTTAVKVAKVLRNSVKEVTCKRKGGKKSMHSDFYKLCKKIEFLSEPKNVECEKKETDVEYVEVYNSFRPSVSAAISAKRLEQIEVLSESENEHEVAVECKTEIVGGPVRGRGPTATLWVSRIT